MQIDMILGGVFCYVFIDHDVLCTWMDWMFVCYGVGEMNAWHRRHSSKGFGIKGSERS